MTAAEQKRFYARHGYLIVPRLLTPRELGRLRAALAEVLDRARRLTGSTRTFRLVTGLDGRHHVKRVWDPIAQHRAFYKLAFDSRILDVVERLIGRNIQLHQSRLNLKPRTPQAWFDGTRTTRRSRTRTSICSSSPSISTTRRPTTAA